MGYSTTFKGDLIFTKEISEQEINKLKTFLGEDCREHPEWNRTDLSYIDLEITKDGKGLRWDGSEKTYDLVDKVNVIIDEMQVYYPDFGLSGKILAQGEDIEDRWILAIENGKAVTKEINETEPNTNITCPNCNHHFSI